MSDQSSNIPSVVRQVEDDYDLKNIENSFTYHAPKGDQLDRYQHLRSEAKALAKLIVEHVPPGRERTRAIAHIEEAIMWANKGIACQEADR